MITQRPPKSSLRRGHTEAEEPKKFERDPRYSIIRANKADTTTTQPGGIAQLVDKLIVIKGKSYDLARRPYVAPILNLGDLEQDGRRRVVLMTGRQVEKTSLVAAKTIVMSHIIPYFRSVYVAPRFNQVQEFSNQRFAPIFKDSTEIYRAQWSTKCMWQVMERQFRNGSTTSFRSCYLSADGARGLSANFLLKDEVQDIFRDNVDILDEILAHSEPEPVYLADSNEAVMFPMKYRMDTGTPKTGTNTLALLYKKSCQFEWVVRCNACRHLMILDGECLSPTAYLCTNKKCRKPIDVRNGKWEAQKPQNLDYSWGFRIPQMMVPFMTAKEIYEKAQDKTPRALNNEVFGLPYDIGVQTLTEHKMRAACTDAEPIKIRSEYTDDTETTGIHRLWTGRKIAGVDWGSGEGANPSYTVMAIGTPEGNDKFRILYILKFRGRLTDLSIQPTVINQLAREVNVEAMGCDYGFGAYANRTLITQFGWSPSMHPENPMILEYQSVMQYAKARWKPDGSRYIIDKSTCVEEVIDAITRQRMIFPKWEYMESNDFVKDFTDIVADHNERKSRTTYDSTGTDDIFMACMYAWLTWQQLTGRLVRPVTLQGKGMQVPPPGHHDDPAMGPMGRIMRRQEDDPLGFY